MPTYSVSYRLQRVTTETAHVSVPLSQDLWQPNADGSETIDTDKLMAKAIELGSLPSTRWTSDGDAVVQPHPIQTPPE